MPPRPHHLALPRGQPPGQGSRAGRCVNGTRAPAVAAGWQAERERCRRCPVQLFPPQSGAGCVAAEPSGAAGPGGPPAAAGAEPRGRQSFFPLPAVGGGPARRFLVGQGGRRGAPCRGRGPATAGLPGSPGPAVRRGEPGWCPRPAGVPGATERGVRRKRRGGRRRGVAAPRLPVSRSPLRAVPAAPRPSSGRGTAVSAQPCPGGGGAAPPLSGAGARDRSPAAGERLVCGADRHPGGMLVRGSRRG